MKHSSILSIFAGAALSVAAGEAYSKQIDRPPREDARAEQKAERERATVAADRAQQQRERGKLDDQTPGALTEGGMGEHREPLGKEQRRLAEVTAKLAEERAKFEANVDERLEKMKTRAQDVYNRSRLALGSADQKLKDAWSEFEAKRAEAVEWAKKLKAVSEVELTSYEAEVDKRLDQAESALSRLMSKVK
jgi:hypothetical protein